MKNEITQDKILSAAKQLIPSKFLKWCEDMNITTSIENRDEVFNVNTDLTIIKVNKQVLKYENGVLKD